MGSTLAYVAVRAGRVRSGCIDDLVSFGSVSIAPGHWLYSDEDGILASSRALHL